MPVSVKLSARQGVAYIYVSLLLTLFFGLGSSSLSARLMTEAELGSYRLIISVVSVAASALTFGMLSSAGSLLANAKSRRLRNVLWQGALGQAAIVAVGCTAVTSVIVYRSGAGGGSYLLWLVGAALAGSMGWQLLLQETLRAEGRFAGIAILNAAPTALFLVLLVAAWLLDLQISAALCTVLFFLSQGIVALALFASRGRIPTPTLASLVFLARKNRNLGLNVYWATFLGALTAQAGIVALQATRSMSEVGVFALAVTLSAPLAMLPSAVGTAYFSQLAGGNRFPPKVLRVSWLLVAVLAIGYVIVVPFAVHLLYGARYDAVTEPARLCGVAALLHGMGDVYNRYYLANRETRLLLVVVAIVCVVAMAASFLASPSFGLLGTGLARLASSGTYVALVGVRYHLARATGPKVLK